MSTRELEGYLEKKGDAGLVKGWKRRFFRLDGDQLRYYADKETADRPDGEPNGAIDLCGAMVVLNGVEGSRYRFDVAVENDSGRVFVLAASTAPERASWVTALMQVIAAAALRVEDAERGKGGSDAAPFREFTATTFHSTSSVPHAPFMSVVPPAEGGGGVNGGGVTRGVRGGTVVLSSTPVDLSPFVGGLPEPLASEPDSNQQQPTVLTDGSGRDVHNKAGSRETVLDLALASVILSEDGELIDPQAPPPPPVAHHVIAPFSLVPLINNVAPVPGCEGCAGIQAEVEFLRSMLSSAAKQIEEQAKALSEANATVASLRAAMTLLEQDRFRERATTLTRTTSPRGSRHAALSGGASAPGLETTR